MMFDFEKSDLVFQTYRFTFSDIKGLRSRILGEKFGNIDPNLAREGREVEKNLLATLGNGGRPGRTNEFVLEQVLPSKVRMEGQFSGDVVIATETDIVSKGQAYIDYYGGICSAMRIIEVKNRDRLYPMDIFQALWMLTVARLDEDVIDGGYDAIDCVVYPAKSEDYRIVDDQAREIFDEQITLLITIARILAEGKSLKASGRKDYKRQYLDTFNTLLNQITY